MGGPTRQKDRCRLILLDQNGQSVRLTLLIRFSDVNEVTADWIVIDAEITSTTGTGDSETLSLSGGVCGARQLVVEPRSSQVPTTGPMKSALTFIRTVSWLQRRFIW